MSKLLHVRRTWEAHRTNVLSWCVSILSLYTILKLGSEFHRLFFESNGTGAVDLLLRHAEVVAWFSGIDVYSTSPAAVYPPASYLLLWPVLGWLTANMARYFWGGTTMVILGMTSYLLTRKSKASTKLECALASLIFLSQNGTGVTIGNGQLGLHVIFSLLLMFLLLEKEESSFVNDLSIASLFILSLTKPSMSIPFGWLIIFSQRGIRRVLYIVSSYALLTLYAASFQQHPMVNLFKRVILHGTNVATTLGYANLNSWLTQLGLKEFILPASMLLFLGLGVAIWRYKNNDRWILLALCGLVARIWMYHASYDNILTIFVGIALFRMAKLDPDRKWSTAAGILLAINTIAMLCLAHWEFETAPLRWTFTMGHPLVWGIDIIFLVVTLPRTSLMSHDKSRQIPLATQIR